MDNWRRGREAPMQWEFTAGGTAVEPARATTTSAPAADESMADVSMAVLDDEEPQEVISSEHANTQSQQLIRRSESPEDDQDEDEATVINQWPIPPVVGTVINYLVPPVQPTQDPTNASPTHQAQTTLHPREKPLLFLSYAQLLFNASLLFLALYIISAILYTIRLDVLERLHEIEEAYQHSIRTCKRSFELNCLSIPVPPALHQACEDWDACSKKKLSDALGGSRLRVVIEVLSEAWEAGVAGLGWRTLAFSLLLLSVVVGGANSTFNGLRFGAWKKGKRREEEQEREHQPQQQHHQQQAILPPPPPPQQVYYPHPHAHAHAHAYHHAYPATPSRRSKRALASSPSKSAARARGGLMGAGTTRTRDAEWIELSD